MMDRLTIARLVERAIQKDQAAIRALSVWPNAQFADKMFEVATADGYTPDQKIAALRSFIRVISLPDDKIGIGISKDGKLDKLKEAFKIATRVDEKRLVVLPKVGQRYLCLCVHDCSSL